MTTSDTTPTTTVATTAPAVDMRSTRASSSLPRNQTVSPLAVAIVSTRTGVAGFGSRDTTAAVAAPGSTTHATSATQHHSALVIRRPTPVAGSRRCRDHQRRQVRTITPK